MDKRCPIDEDAFYADLAKFEKLSMDPEMCPCDYCSADVCVHQNRPGFEMV